MANFTYDQFETEARNKGLYDSFSQADLNLAQQNPDAGMSILTAKDRYRSATSSEDRSYWNQQAENVRSSYGGYTGGTDGSGFMVNSLSPRQYQEPERPSYDDGGLGSQYSTMLNDLINRDPFRYDVNRDSLYSQYRKQYAREGQRATNDTMASYASMTGGLPSSYAAAAAQQAGNYYSAQMADKIPELYQIAYNKYLQDYQLGLSDLNAVGNAEQTRYNRYQDDMSQWNADRAFSYQQLLDEIGNQQYLDEQGYSRAKDAAGFGDYQWLAGLGYDTTALQQDRDYELRQREQSDADRAASYGDYSRVREQGIDTSYAEATRDNTLRGQELGLKQTEVEIAATQAGIDAQSLNGALSLAAVGIYTGPGSLAELGIDPTPLEQREELNYALQIYESTGNADALGALGIRPSLANIYKIMLAQKGYFAGELSISTPSGSLFGKSSTSTALPQRSGNENVDGTFLSAVNTGASGSGMSEDDWMQMLFDGDSPSGGGTSRAVLNRTRVR